MMQFYLVLFMTGLVCVSCNDFVTEDPATDELRFGHQCTRNAAGLLTVTLKVYEPDLTFADDDGQNLRFTCVMLKTSSLPSLKDPTDTVNCGDNSTTLETINDNVGVTAGPIDQTLRRTHNISIGPFEPTTAAADEPCGMVYTAGLMEFSVYCYLEKGFNHEQVRVNRFKLHQDDCIDDLSMANVTVELPTETEIVRDYLVTFGLFLSGTRNLTTAMELDEERTANAVTAPVALGSTMFAQVCIKLDPAVTPDERMYFVEGVSILGVALRNCRAIPTPLETYYQTPTSPVPVTDGNGCGMNASPFAAWETDSFQFKYAKGEASPYSNLLWYKSPNCFFSDAFEAVSFGRLDVSRISSFSLECDVVYCRETNDSACFGNGVDVAGGAYPGDDYGAPLCPSTTVKRKKRASNADEMPEKLPETVTFRYSVTTDELYGTIESADTGSQTGSGCFRKPTFIGISSGLGGLLVVVLLIDAILAVCLIRKSSNDDKLSGYPESSGHSYASSGNSITGFKNKGFN